MQHHAKKRFGQNFLVDTSVINHIVDSIQPQADDVMIEIGPGLGAMTKPLLSRLNQLNVIELDRDIIPKLIKNCQFADIDNKKKLTVNETDVLKFDFSAFHSRQPAIQHDTEKKTPYRWQPALQHLNTGTVSPAELPAPDSGHAFHAAKRGG